MEAQASSDNTSSQEDQEVIEKIKAVRIHFSNMPSYLQKLLKQRETLKAEYLSSKMLEKKIEYSTFCEAVEKEVLLQQYRTYRQRRGEFRCGPEELKLYAHLIEYIQELVTKNQRARLCYLTTREASYKAKYDGTRNTIKTLVHALDERFHDDIAFLLDNQMIKLSIKK